jgi:hypothetical protein
MEFIREIRQVESTSLSVNVPESFVHHAVEILILPYHADQQVAQNKSAQKSPNKELEELEELRKYFRTLDAPITIQTLTEMKEELYGDLF